MKANGAGFGLVHIEEGHHRATCEWHDNDHKAEVVGSIPGVYSTQRWVTPPEWMKLRAPNDLPFAGGEYINMYWTAETGEELSARFGKLGRELEAAGRMGPMVHWNGCWPKLDGGGPAWHPTTVTAAEKTVTSADAVLASIGMTGLVSVIETAHEGVHPAEVTRRQTEEIIPAVLATGLFEGAARLASDRPGLEGTAVLLYYVHADDPAEVFGEYRRFHEARSKTDKSFATHRDSVKTVFESVSRPSMGHYDFYD